MRVRVMLGYVAAGWVGASITPLMYWMYGEVPGLSGPLATLGMGCVMYAFAEFPRLPTVK